MGGHVVRNFLAVWRVQRTALPGGRWRACNQTTVQIICQPACKPGFVWPRTRALNVAAIHLGKALPPSSCNLPGHSGRKGLLWFPKARCPYSVLLPAGFAMPPALPHARWALTPPFHPYLNSGGSISVALSLGSPPPAVNRRRFSVEPGLSSLPAFRQMDNAAARPAGPALKRGQRRKGKHNNAGRRN